MICLSFKIIFLSYFCLAMKWLSDSLRQDCPVIATYCISVWFVDGYERWQFLKQIQYIYLMGFIYFSFSTYFGFMAFSVFMTWFFVSSKILILACSSDMIHEKISIFRSKCFLVLVEYATNCIIMLWEKLWVCI